MTRLWVILGTETERLSQTIDYLTSFYSSPYYLFEKDTSNKTTVIQCRYFSVTCSLRNTILALCFPKPICEGVNLSGT